MTLKSQKLRGPQTKVIDAGGKLVLPGFVDCHIHFIEGSISLGQANLESAKNPADIQRILREYAAKHPGDGWILGGGWNYAMFGEENLPNKKYLDEVFPNRPVLLYGYDGHTSWANSKALALAKIEKDTPNPANGAIVRDPKTGEATGALKESAGSLVGKLVPKPTREEKLAALRAGFHWANENGLTRVHSAGGDFEEFALYDELRRHGDLTLRMYIAYFLDPPELRPKDLAAIEEARTKYTGDWLSGGVVKMMIDGVIESHTAAMLEPYTDDPSTKGKLFWDPDKYKAAVAELDKRGLQLFTHAIGDYAVRTALDAYENAENVNHTQDRRPRIEHIETITAADIPRFGKLGVIASMQPLHAYPDEDTLASLGRQCWTRPRLARVGLEQHREVRRTSGVRQRLECRDAESVGRPANGRHAPDHGGQARRRLDAGAASYSGAGGRSLHARRGLRRASRENGRLDRARETRRPHHRFAKYF